MPAKKSSPETQPSAQDRPRARKKSSTESGPAPSVPPPAAPAPSSLRWFAPVAIALAVAVLSGLLLAIHRPLDLAAAEQRLARMEAILDSSAPAGEGSQGDVSSTQRVARICRESLREMVRMWNAYVRELKARESGRRVKVHAAERRFDTAREQASLAIRRCEAA